jgi:hypothetical protein
MRMDRVRSRSLIALLFVAGRMHARHACLLRCAVVALMSVLWLAGCAGSWPARVGGTKGDGLPAGLDRESLLTGIAACHLRRVAQNADRGATDAVVIAAVERYDFSVEQMIERSNALMRAAATDAAERESLRALSRDACEQLSALTGVPSSLVRFDATGKLDNTWVSVTGEIDAGFADTVIGRLRRDKAIGLLINSPGGSLFEARRLGRYLRANGLRVGVDGLCTSACVDVLAGGIERYVTSNAMLGIHQSRVPKHLSSHEGGQLSVVAAALYLREMGVDEGIALAAAAVPNNSMYWIPVSEALKTGLATKVVGEL